MLAIMSILSGFFYFNEVAAQTPKSIGLFCAGVAIVLIGIAVGMLRKLQTGALVPTLEDKMPVEKTSSSPLLMDAPQVVYVEVPSVSKLADPVKV